MIHHNVDSLVNFHCCALLNIHLHIHTIARPTHIYYHMYNFGNLQCFRLAQLINTFSLIQQQGGSG